MLELRGPDDWRSDLLFLQHPSQGDLRAGNASGLRNRGHTLNHGAVRLESLRVERFAEFVRFLPPACFVPILSQPSARHGTPGDNADAFSPTERQHFTFLFAIQEVQVILHCREARPTMEFRDIEGASELPSGHVAGADVARLA